ncbi:MAG: DUF4007 family protein [Candidatus Schekmanbacteria bacterium]|nr:DUF4007 family protein [Candidatus Schekmanbacteria bacterium]
MCAEPSAARSRAAPAAAGPRYRFSGHQTFPFRDPFLEDPASLWLIHGKLSTHSARAAAWYLAFHRFTRSELTKDDLTDFLCDFAARAEIMSRLTMAGAGEAICAYNQMPGRTWSEKEKSAPRPVSEAISKA